MLIRYTLIGWFLVASAALSAPPTVTAPQKACGEVGDWVFITAISDGKGVRFVPLDDGLAVFPAGKLKDTNETAVRATKAGVYRVLVYTGNAEGPSEPAIVYVTFGNPGPGPGPGPVVPVVPPSDGKFGMAKASRDGAKLVPQSARTADLVKLAKAQRSLSSAIAAGGVTDPSAILSVWREGNKSSVTSGADWKPWADSVTPALSKLYQDGKLADKSAWSAVFSEIADGLEQAN